MLARLRRRSVEVLPECEARGIANIVHGAAHVGLEAGELFEAVASAAVGRLRMLPKPSRASGGSASGSAGASAACHLRKRLPSAGEERAPFVRAGEWYGGGGSSLQRVDLAHEVGQLRRLRKVEQRLQQRRLKPHVELEHAEAHLPLDTAAG